LFSEDLPTFGRMIVEQATQRVSAEEADARIEAAYRTKSIPNRH